MRDVSACCTITFLSNVTPPRKQREETCDRSASVLLPLFACLFCSSLSVYLSINFCRRGTREKSHGTERKQALGEEEEEEEEGEMTTQGSREKRGAGISCD